MARVDRERYEAEKAAYTGPWKIPDVKSPNAPKKPMSSFLAFSNERRGAIAEANPNMNGTELSILLAKLWKECPADVKQSYRDREMKEREIYKRQRSEWEHQQDMILTLQAIGSNPPAVLSADTTDASGDVPPAIPAQCAQAQPDVQHAIQPLPVFPSSKAFDTQSTQTSVLSNLLAPSLPKPFGGLVPADPSRILQAATDASSLPSPSEDRFVHPTCNFTLPSQSIPMSDFTLLSNQSRFEHYSLDDIMQDDELFEDFSPGDVPPTPNNCSSQSTWDGNFY